MDGDRLTLEETRQMLLSVAGVMIESKQPLTRADQAIGDGDHGIGMARGFEEVRRKLESDSFASAGALFTAAGSALMASIGGASGAIFGTLFRGGAKALGETQEFGSEQLAAWLEEGLQAVKERGKARPGDKTMVDALEPAAQAAREAASRPIGEAVAAVAEAARKGMERTKEMVAATGKARTLGERSLGSPDPGAISMYLILRSIAEYTTQHDVASKGGR